MAIICTRCFYFSSGSEFFCIKLLNSVFSCLWANKRTLGSSVLDVHAYLTVKGCNTKTGERFWHIYFFFKTFLPFYKFFNWFKLKQKKDRLWCFVKLLCGRFAAYRYRSPLLLLICTIKTNNSNQLCNVSVKYTAYKCVTHILACTRQIQSGLLVANKSADKTDALLWCTYLMLWLPTWQLFTKVITLYLNPPDSAFTYSVTIKTLYVAIRIFI